MEFGECHKLPQLGIRPHVLAHFELQRIDLVTRNVPCMMIVQKHDFMNPALDGRNTPRKWENCVKSGKVGLSA